MQLLLLYEFIDIFGKIDKLFLEIQFLFLLIFICWNMLDFNISIYFLDYDLIHQIM